MNKKLIGILVVTLLITTVVSSISGKTSEHQFEKAESDDMFEAIYDEILFSDDFNDNRKDYSKWTEIYTSGIWEETNGRAEFQLTESGGTGTRSEGIESSPFEGFIGGDEPWENKIELTWKMLPNIGSTSEVGKVAFRITDGINWIEMGYNRLSCVAYALNSADVYDQDIGGDEPWENKLEIYGNEYHVTMNSNSFGVYDSVFSSGTSTFNVQIYIEVGGSTRTLYLHSGFDDIVVKGIESVGEPPSAPLIDGRINGEAGVDYPYSFTSTDPNGNDVYYYVEWGDGSNSGWIGSYNSGETATAKHTWAAQGTYTIEAKAKDTNDLESDWGTLTVTMPKNKAFNINPLFLRFLEKHPRMFPLLRHLLGL